MSKDIVYEARCHHCQTSFAPETRHCVHCGAPLGKGRQSAAAGEDFDPDRPAEEGEPIAKGARTAIWVVMALLTAVASVFRSCIE